METGCNLEESSKEGYGLRKGVVLPMKKMMMMKCLTRKNEHVFNSKPITVAARSKA
jgi:hypothetical protein